MINAQPLTSQKHILVVDDEPALTKLLSFLLESHGYKVSVAHTGEDALTKSVQDMYDLVLLDLVLPGLSGARVAQALKANPLTCRMPIIVLSGKRYFDHEDKLLHPLIDDFLEKPFERKELLSRIEVILNRHKQAPKQNGILVRDEIKQELETIIRDEKIVPYFQPIYLLKPFKLLGLEVLTRPHSESALKNPEELFNAAYRCGLYYSLEKLAWRKALDILKGRLADENVFVNCNPCVVIDRHVQEITGIFSDHGIESERVIMEITERTAISENGQFSTGLDAFRSKGFRFAIDDVGGGYASLETIVETKPEVVKIDRHIISNVDSDPYKRSMVKLMVSFCREHGIISIVEGIEREEELRAALELGVDAGQGYYLYRPSRNLDMRDIHNRCGV